MSKKTFQPNKKKRKRDHGFKARMKTKSGRSVLKRRRAKGRKDLSASEEYKLLRKKSGKSIR